MSSEIRALTESDMDAYVNVQALAYPGMNLTTPEARRQFADRASTMFREDPARVPFGLFRDGVMAGAMFLIDFTMRLFEGSAPVGGIADVAVALTHRKAHVAKEMMQFALGRFRERGQALAVLYPFRPDFYTRMGFGYGAPIHEYRVRPDALPNTGSRERVRLLSVADKAAFIECYRGWQQRTHGMIERPDWEAGAIMGGAGAHVAGLWRDGQIEGYLVFRFETKPQISWLKHDLRVREMCAPDAASLRELLSFLRTLLDQVDRVIITTFDGHLHHLFLDPRDGSDRIIPSVYHQTHTSGVGLMWRDVHTARLFEALAGHDFGGQSCRLRVTIDDPFMAENAGSTVVHFDRGAAHIVPAGEWDVELSLRMADWSSLVLGVIDLHTLHRYGLARLSDDRYLEAVDRLFKSDAPPQCVTPF